MFFVCVKLIIFHLEVNRISRKFTLICPILFNIFPFPSPKGYQTLIEEFLVSYPQSYNIEKTITKSDTVPCA